MIFILMFCLTVGITGSIAYAYLIDKNETVNQVRFVDMENKTHIEEEFETPEDVDPGQIIKKKPCIFNDSEIPVYVRAMVSFSNSAAQELCEPISINKDWKEREDGYCYYQKKLGSKERTNTIFDNIVIKNTIKKEEIIPFDVLVYEESVQAEGFLTPEEAFAGM